MSKTVRVSKEVYAALLALMKKGKHKTPSGAIRALLTSKKLKASGD